MSFEKRGGPKVSKFETSEPPRLVSVDKLEEEARQQLLNFLDRGAKSSKELRAKMLEREVPENLVNQLIERFTEVGLIDDAGFAESLVNNRRSYQRLSKTAIKRDLISKGVSAEIAEQSVADISVEDETALAKELAVKRFGQLARFDRDVRYRRLSGFLSRKGYPYQIIKPLPLRPKQPFHTAPDRAPLPLPCSHGCSSSTKKR